MPGMLPGTEQLTGHTASVQANVFWCALSQEEDKAGGRFLCHEVSRPVVILCSVIFSLLSSAFNHIYIIICLIVFVLCCLLLLSLTFLVIQPLGCERDINKLLLLLLLLIMLN